jgi:hypothetical protein
VITGPENFCSVDHAARIRYIKKMVWISALSYAKNGHPKIRW